jgi:FkbM family methyltransferase
MLANNAVAKYLHRLLHEPWLVKIKIAFYLVGRVWRKFRIRFLGWLPIPIRLPYRYWCLVWPDVMGDNLLKGGFEENEFRFVERFLKPGMIVFDAGAHSGFYTLLAAYQVGETGSVTAFEPSSRERHRLQWNLALNRCRNVRVEPFALGDHQGYTDFFVVLGIETGCNSIRPPAVNDPIRRVKVPITILDDYVCWNQIKSVDLIKLDVEGAELSVLKGARGFLTKRPRPILICELVDMRTVQWNYRAHEIHKFLTQLGFTWFSAIEGGYLRPAPEKDHYHENLIAVPEEKLFEVREWIKEV